MAQRSENKARASQEQALLHALRAEVEYCGRQARIYVEQKIQAPAYRLPKRIYDFAFTTLIGSVFDAGDVEVLIAFYSQVDQVNWGLNEVDRLIKLHGIRPGASEAPQVEYKRLYAKAEELMSPQSDFYTRAIAALNSRLR